MTGATLHCHVHYTAIQARSTFKSIASYLEIFTIHPNPYCLRASSHAPSTPRPATEYQESNIKASYLEIYNEALGLVVGSYGEALS